MYLKEEIKYIKRTLDTTEEALTRDTKRQRRFHRY